MSIASPSPSGSMKFPCRLHCMLDNSEELKLAHIASWLPCGKAFAIHDQKEFLRTVMPIYFPGMASYKSFRRQLSLYGIYQRRKPASRIRRKRRTDCEKVFSAQSGAPTGIYSHPLLIRGNRSLCELVSRRQTCPTKIPIEQEVAGKGGSRWCRNLDAEERRKMLGSSAVGPEYSLQQTQHSVASGLPQPSKPTSCYPRSEVSEDSACLSNHIANELHVGENTWSCTASAAKHISKSLRESARASNALRPEPRRKETSPLNQEELHRGEIFSPDSCEGQDASHRQRDDDINNEIILTFLYC